MMTRLNDLPDARTWEGLVQTVEAALIEYMDANPGASTLNIKDAFLEAERRVRELEAR